MDAQASHFPVPKKNKYYPLIALALIAVGVLLNVLPAKFALALNWPLARLCTAAASSASSSPIGGRIPGRSPEGRL